MVLDAPACTWGCAGEGESVLARIHVAHILPAEDESGKRQFLPVFWRRCPSAGWFACRGGSSERCRLKLRSREAGLALAHPRNGHRQAKLLSAGLPKGASESISTFLWSGIGSKCQTRRIRPRHRSDGNGSGGGGETPERRDKHLGRGGFPHQFNLRRGQAVGMEGLGSETGVE